nr:uncharacterized protein LOC113715180 isoform X2 [Coffea arabica]
MALRWPYSSGKTEGMRSGRKKRSKMAPPWHVRKQSQESLQKKTVFGKEEAEKVQWRRRRRREQTAAYPDYCNTEKARDRGCMAASQLTGKEEAEKVQWRRRRRREQTAAYPDYCNTEKARDRGCMAASQLEMGIKEQKLKISILGLNSQSKLTAKHALNRK